MSLNMTVWWDLREETLIQGGERRTVASSSKLESVCESRRQPVVAETEEGCATNFNRGRAIRMWIVRQSNGFQWLGLCSPDAEPCITSGTYTYALLAGRNNFLELESPPTSDNKDKIDETLEEKIVKLKGKEDDSNIPTFDQPEKPEEHEDGGGDHIIHDDDVDDGEMDHEEKFCDEEDYDPDSYDKPKDTINEDVWDPFPIVPQTQYSGYDDLAREDVDKNDDHNDDYKGSDKNPNKEENHKLKSWRHIF
eukprot:Gb_02073 [translate_table: standard]